MSEILLHSRCLRCHRKLKNPIFQRIGYGKICLSKCMTLSLEEKEKLTQQMNKLLLELKEEKKHKKLEVPSV
jgi:hypothetical protein